MDLTTLAAVKAFMPNLTGTTADTLLSSMITAYSAFIERYCSRTFGQNSYTETRDGTGRQELVLSNFPVTAISSLQVFGSITEAGLAYPMASAVTVPAAADPTQPGWRLLDVVRGDQRRLVVQGGYYFPRGQGNVVVAYTAGYTNTAAVPADLAQACNELVALRWQAKDRLGYKSKTLAGENVTFDTKVMPDHIAALLGPYQEMLLPS